MEPAGTRKEERMDILTAVKTPEQVKADRRKWWVLVAMVFGLFMPVLDNLVVNVALPTIQDKLGAGV